MKRCLWITLATVLTGAPITAAQKPVNESRVHLDTARPPAQIEDLFAQAGGVALVKLLSHNVEERQGDARFPGLVLTRFDAQVIEPFKRDQGMPMTGGHIAIVVIGGDLDRGDHIERVIDADSNGLSNGRQYVVFVKWNQS